MRLSFVSIVFHTFLKGFVFLFRDSQGYFEEFVQVVMSVDDTLRNAGGATRVHQPDHGIRINVRQIGKFCVRNEHEVCEKDPRQSRTIP